MNKGDAPLCGAEVVARLLPQRPPLAMVDVVLEWKRGPKPSLRAARFVSASEPVFAGHFPDRPLWPGVFTIEGLAQSCRVLGTLERLAEARTAERTVEALRALERRLRGERHDEADARALELELAAMAGPGLLVAVDVRFTSPVFPGSVLEFDVARVRSLDDLVRFEVAAAVAGRTVAEGTMTTARPAA